MSQVKKTIDVLVEARHRLITDSALEMNRMSKYISYLSCDRPMETIMTSTFRFNFNNDNYINTYMIDINVTDNTLYQLIISNYHLFLSLTTEIKKLKQALLESYLIFWDSFVTNYSNDKPTKTHNKVNKYISSRILQKCDSLFIINCYINNIYAYNEKHIFPIPKDITYLIDKFYKTFYFQKCNPS
eukprot:325922_1